MLPTIWRGYKHVAAVAASTVAVATSMVVAVAAVVSFYALAAK